MNTREIIEQTKLDLSMLSDGMAEKTETVFSYDDYFINVTITKIDLEVNQLKKD